MEGSLVRDLEATREHVRSLHEFFCQHAKLCNAHAVGFFTEDHWRDIVKADWRGLLQEIEEETEWVTELKVPHGELRDSVLCRVSELKLPLVSDPFDGHLITSRLGMFGMNSKKSHEVCRMSECVTMVTKQTGLEQVVDIGSGKGYLSEHLAVCHKLTVVGMDSECSNTTGAIERCRKVEKAHRGSELSRNAAVPLPVGLSGTDERVLTDLSGLFGEKSIFEISENKEGMLCCQAPDSSPLTSCSRTNHQHVPHRESNASNTMTEPCLSFIKPLEKSYTAVTHRVTPSLPIMTIAEEVSGGKLRASQPTLIVGLHTCGDLACTALRLFASTVALQGACVVGCCYNHVTEQTEEDSCFPMSKFLQSHKAVLGRNARMLACQSERKFADMTTGTALESLFFRAVLQVILETEFGIVQKDTNSFQDFSVGRIKKYSGFVDYARKALSNLGITDDTLTDETINSYHKEYLSRKIHLQRFIQLRAVLAPVIESLILLDRVLYLQELGEAPEAHKLGGCIEKVWLTQLFSPSLSPRCFAICALKV